MPEMEAMTRDVVAEQFAKLGGSLEPAAPEPAAEPDVAADEPAAASEPESAQAESGRDEKGRFKAKSTVEQAPEAKGEAPTKPAAPAPAPAAAPELKAPADWRAEARGEFAKLPRVVQEEALRLYGETRKTLDRAAQLEKDVGGWQQPLAPFEHIFRARGMTAQQGVAQLVQTYAALHTAPVPMRSKIIAQLIRDHVGTDEASLRMLGAEIDGMGAPQSVQAPQAMHPEQIRQLARQEWETAQQEQARRAAVQTWKEFEGANQEFLNEPGFRQRLAVELSIAMDAKGGAQPTKADIQAAYDAACGSHPSVAKIVNQRKEAEAAGKANASTQARTAAAVGIKNEPVVAASTSEPADTVRDEVKRQYARLSNKRR